MRAQRRRTDATQHLPRRVNNMTSGVYKRTPEHNAANSKAQMGQLPLCECGCGEPVAKKGNRFIYGHNQRGKSHTPETRNRMQDVHTNVLLSPEHCAAVSEGIRNSEAVKAHNESMRGVSRSPEHCDNISESMKNSEDVKANTDRMRGGQDMIWHHYIYDHANPKKYTMEVTRSKHGKIHVWMKRAGIVVPHINVKEDGCDK